MQANQATIKLECEKIKISELMQILQNVEDGIKNKAYTESEVYIQEVSKGSMVFELIQIISSALPLIENINSVVTFLESLNKYKEIFKEAKMESIQEGDIQIIKNLGGISSVIKNCPNANIIINNPTTIFSLSTSESQKIQPQISDYLSSQTSQEKHLTQNDTIDNALIYYHQTNVEKDKLNKAICEKVSKKPVQTIFGDEDIKTKILENPYGYNFVVDLEVQYREDKPTLYTILRLKNRFKKDN